MTKKTKRSTTSPTTGMVNNSKSCTDTFTGKPKRVDKDGDCFFTSLAALVKSDKKQVRKRITAWLKANPNTPFHTCTLSAYT